MSSDSQSLITWFLSSIWNFFTEVEVPGLGFSFGVLAIGLLVARLSFSVIGIITGFSTGGAMSAATGFRRNIESTSHYIKHKNKKGDN